MDLQNNEKIITFKDTIDRQKELLREAKTVLKTAINKRKTTILDELEVKPGGGQGVETKENDRRMYAWVECWYKGKEYDINLFHSEIDSYSGNCHCQIGKVMFTKGYVKNKSDITSTNIIIQNDTGRYITNKKSTCLIFNSYKWENPLDYFESTDSSKLNNGKWITVDDVLRENFADKIADAFIKYVSADKTNIPETYWEYASMNGFEEVLWDKKAETYYDKLANIINKFSIMQPYEFEDFSEIESDIKVFKFDRLMKIYVKNNRVSNSDADQLLKLLEDEIFQLGAEYGFLADIVLELFLYGKI